MGSLTTGLPVRIVREGRWVNVDLDELTDAELDAFALRAYREGRDGWPWAKALARWVRDHVRDGTTEAGGRVGRFVWLVDEGLRRLPERVSAEASAAVAAVIAEAIAATRREGGA